MRLETGGVVRAVLDLCAALQHAGHDVSLLTADASDVPPDWLDHAPGCPRAVAIEPPTRPGGLFSAAARRCIGAFMDDADVLHLHSMWTVANMQLAAEARRRRLPYVYSVHGMLDDWCMSQRRLKKRLYMALFGRRMLEGAAAVHLTAGAELEQARKWFPRGRGVVVPLVFDLAPYRCLPGPEPARSRLEPLRSGRPVLLFLSRLHYKKRPELLIEAAAVLAADGRDPLVVLAGTGDAAYVESLRALAAARGLDGRVLLPGFISGVEKVSLFQAADLFVLPTSQENFGFVLFEALAAGTPVVTTRGADTWPELEASGGAVIAAADATSIAHLVGDLLDDEARRREMAAAGRAWVLDHLDGHHVVARFERLYAESVSSRPPAAGTPSLP